MKTDKLYIKIRGYDLKAVEDVAKRIRLKVDSELKEKNDMIVKGPIFLKVKIKKRALLRARVGHKKHWEQFGTCIFSRLISVINPYTKLLLDLAAMKHPSSVLVKFLFLKKKKQVE